jgi:hypothetical protein
MKLNDLLVCNEKTEKVQEYESWRDITDKRDAEASKANIEQMLKWETKRKERLKNLGM